MGEIAGCGICGSADLAVILDMGLQPLAERESKLYPLKLVQCGDCSLVELSYIVDQATVFPLDHPYATGNTGALRQHFARLAAKLGASLSGGDLVVDIAANDGTLINAYWAGLRREIG